MTADAPDLIDAGVHQQPMQPGVEPIRVAQRGQITPGTDEGVLDGVRRPVRVPDHEPGGRVEAGDRGACQLGEGVMIALPRSLHEVSLSSRPSGGGAAQVAALAEYGVAGRGMASPLGSGSSEHRPGAGPTRYHHAPAQTSEARQLEPAPVKIQEADAKSLLVAQGLPVPAWEVAHTGPRRAPRPSGSWPRRRGRRHQGPGPRRRPRQGRRREAGLRRGRGRARRRARSSGMDIKGITVRKVLVAAGGRHRPRVLHVGRPRPRRAVGSC